MELKLGVEEGKVEIPVQNIVTEAVTQTDYQAEVQTQVQQCEVAWGFIIIKL